MTTNEVGFIVDKIAEKLNVAVDKVQPIAEEALRQYVMRETFFAYINWGIAGLLFLAAIACFIRHCTVDYYRKYNDSEPFYLWIAIVITFITIFPFIIAINNYGNAIAPLPSIFKF